MARKQTKNSDQVTEREVDEAIRIIKRDYYQDVKGLAEDLIEAIKDGEIEDTEELQERLREDVDGSQRVIYTMQNHLGLLASDNSDAYIERFGEAPIEGGDINYAALMAAAMEQDVLDELGDLDDLFEEEDEEEDDE